jgi:hypothetical protein
MNWKGKLIAAAACIGMFGLMIYAYSDVEFGQSQNREESMEELAEGIFTTHLVGFEALGILLTAVMIGAMVIAKPLGGRMDSENYNPTKDLTASQLVSDVDRNLEDKQ